MIFNFLLNYLKIITAIKILNNTLLTNKIINHIYLQFNEATSTVTY